MNKIILIGTIFISFSTPVFSQSTGFYAECKNGDKSGQYASEASARAAGPKECAYRGGLKSVGANNQGRKR